MSNTVVKASFVASLGILIAGIVFQASGDYRIAFGVGGPLMVGAILYGLRATRRAR